MYASTAKALGELTDFSAFEALCCDLLSSYGDYGGIIPQGSGKIDGGKDALLVLRTADSITAVRRAITFHFSTRRDYETKFRQDLASLLDRQASWPIQPVSVVFVSSRSISPHTRDRLEKDLASQCGLPVTILDQDWLRIPLDNGYQYLRKKYLGIEYDKSAFVALDDLLGDPNRRPNAEDIAQGCVVPRDRLRSDVHQHLDAKRICLLVGPPGSGKTGLSRLVGWDHEHRSIGNVAFYISARVTPSSSVWLEAMRASDYRHVLFIIEDLHTAVAAGNALAEQIRILKHARVLLTTRPVDSTLRGPRSVSYFGILKDCTCSATLRKDDAANFMSFFLGGRALEDKSTVTAQAREFAAGDLHLLNYFTDAYSETRQGVDELRLFTDIYARYAEGDEACLSTMLYVAALSQFEIPVAVSVLDPNCVASMKRNAWIDTSIVPWPPGHQECVSFFHSTPARWFLRSVHRLGKLSEPDLDAYVDSIVLHYLSRAPANYLNAMQRWLRQAGDSKISILVEAPDSVAPYARRYLSHDALADGAELVLAAVVYDLFYRSEQRLTEDLFGSHLDLLFADRNEAKIQALIADLSLLQIMTIRQGFGDQAKRMIARVLSQMDEATLLNKLDNSGFSYLLNSTGKADDRVFVLETLCRIDFKAFIARVGRPTFKRVKEIVFDLSRARLPPSIMDRYLDAIEFPTYAQSGSYSSLAALRPVIQFCKQAGIRKELIKAFVENADLARFGRIHPKTKFNNVRIFLDDARFCGASTSHLQSLTDELDWGAIGESHGLADSTGSRLFLFRFLSSHDCVRPKHALQFLAGFGWGRIADELKMYYSPDVVAALDLLLRRKCGLTTTDLQQFGVDLRGRVIWTRSFVERPCPQGIAGHEAMRRRFFAYATAGLERFGGLSRPFLEASSLKEINLLIHNLSMADITLLETRVAPFLESLGAAGYARLFEDSDTANIGIHLAHLRRFFRGLDFPAGFKIDLERLRGQINQSELDAVGYLLLAFHRVGRPDLAESIAEAVVGCEEWVCSAVAVAEEAHLDRFFWHYWLGHAEDATPRLLRSAAVTEIVRTRLRGLMDLRSRAGILGSWRIAGTMLRPTSSASCSPSEVQALLSTILQAPDPSAVRIIAGLEQIIVRRYLSGRTVELLAMLETLLFEIQILKQDSSRIAVQNWLRALA